MAQRKPRVLVAGIELAIETCDRLLGESVELVAARSIEEALRLDASVDLIISTVRFDESRMFDFLEAVRAHCAAPVICCRMVRSPLSVGMYRSIETATTALGVKAFIDMDSEIREHGQAEAERRLRELVYAHLPRETRVTT